MRTNYEAAKELYRNGHIEYWDYKTTAKLPITNKNKQPTISIDVWRLLHDATINIVPMNNSYKDELINDALPDDVSEIQGNLPIPPERRPNWIQILKLCPAAIKMLVNPVSSIAAHRRPEDKGDSSMDEMDLTFLERQMINLLLYDYRKTDLGEYFKKHDIQEMETVVSFTAKSTTGKIIEINGKQRHRLPPADKSLGVPYVPIILRPDHPEPLGRCRSDEAELPAESRSRADTGTRTKKAITIAYSKNST